MPIEMQRKSSETDNLIHLFWIGLLMLCPNAGKIIPKIEAVTIALNICSPVF